MKTWYFIVGTVSGVKEIHDVQETQADADSVKNSLAARFPKVNFSIEPSALSYQGF